MYGYDNDCDCREVYDASCVRVTKDVQEALDLLDASPGTRWTVLRRPKKDWDFSDLGFKRTDFGKTVLYAEPSIPSDPIIYNPTQKRWFDLDGMIAY